MTNTSKCVTCNNVATTDVLDELMVAFDTVCDDCYYDVFNDVVQHGREYFIDWAIIMYGNLDKATKLADIAFEHIDKVEAEPREDEMGTMMMFTYGILKYPSNLKREGALEIVENCTVRGHRMHLYNRSFPITSKSNNPNEVIYGTLFEIPKLVVTRNYDHVEGYVPGRASYKNMYNREKIEVIKPNGEIVEAEMYYANGSVFSQDINKYTHIPTGNFDDKSQAKSFYNIDKYAKKGGKK